MRHHLALLLTLAACGPGRDKDFVEITLLEAVNKIDVSDSFVYWVESSALKRVEKKKNGTVEVVLASSVTDFSVTKTSVYAATTDGILKLDIPPVGKTSTPVLIGPGSARAIAADANGVSWVSCELLVHAAPDGTNQRSTPMPLGTCGNAPLKLSVDSSTAYGIYALGVWYASRTGAPVKKIANAACEHIGPSGGWLYCGAQTGLFRIDPFTASTEAIIAGEVHAFDFSDTRVYAAVGMDLVSAPLNTTQVDVLGTLAAVSAIAVDGRVYFVNTEGDRGLMLSTAP